MDEVKFSNKAEKDINFEIYGSNKSKYHELSEKYVERRIEEIKGNTIVVNGEFTIASGSYTCKDISIEKQKLIGNKAEYFFHRYLAAKFGNEYNQYENWRSLTRAHYFNALSK